MGDTKNGCLKGEGERFFFLKGKQKDHLVRTVVKEFHFG